MARLSRIVVPGCPRHVTQCGNRRAQTFFEDGDYQLYKDLLSEAAARADCEVWCYCLMPNHVHLIVVPEDEDGLRRTFADAHRRYTGYINARLRVTGHLWQGQFGSVVMDEDHLVQAVRYVSLNPARAGLADWADKWPWSSVKAHLDNRDDGLVTVKAVLDRYGPFDRFVSLPDADDEGYSALRQSETTGRPVGSEDWIKAIEFRTGRTLLPQRRGPKPGRGNA